MALLEITTPRTVLFSKTDVFFVSLKKTEANNTVPILIWFDDNSTSKPEFWNIERHYDCSQYTSDLESFNIFSPEYVSPNNDVISIAFSLKQDEELPPGEELPPSTSLTINFRLSNQSNSEIVTTTLYYQSTYNPFSTDSSIYSVNQNYNIPFTSDGTKQLLRTNPKLTGNVKISVDNNQNVWLNTIDANLELSSNRFKKYKVSSNSTYAYDLRKLLDEGKLDSKILFSLNEKDSTSVKSNYSEQYNTFYWSGCEYLNSLLYDENFSIFAPLWIDKNIPDYFVIFSSPEIISDNLKSDSENFKSVIVNNSKIVKVFSLKPGTILGDYLRGIVNSSIYNSSPIKVNFENLKSITYRGVDFKNGIYTEKNELIDDLVTEDNPILFFEEKIIEGFERNNLICYNLLNLEFLFNDTEAYEFDINRYYGFYVNENELSKFTIDPEGFSELYSYIPKSKVKVDNESRYDVFDTSGVTIVAKNNGISKYPSSELISESERIFYIKGKYNLYKIKDSSIKETKVENLFSKSVRYLNTNQNYLDLSDITGFSKTKFNAKAEIKSDYGYPFDINLLQKLNDSDSVSFIYQRGNIQKEWKVIANSYAVPKGETLEEEIVKDPQNINISTNLQSVLSYTDFNVGQFEISDLINFELGTSIEVEFNNKILSGYKSTSETVTLTSGDDTFTVSNIEYLSVDQLVTGDGIPVDTYITAIDNSTNEITISNDASTSGSSSLTFSAFLVIQGDYSSELLEDDSIEIINLDTRSSFICSLSKDSILHNSTNTFLNISTDDSLIDILLLPNKFSVNLDYKNNPTYNKRKFLEISDISQNTTSFKTFLSVKDESKVIANSTNVNADLIFTLRYSYEYIYNYFNPDGSISESLNSIIKAFNTFDFKKFTITKKDSGFIIRSEFEPDAVVKVKIDLSNNHTNLIDIQIHKINGLGYLYKYSGSTPEYKKIILHTYQYGKQRSSFLINSIFSRNISGDEWIKTLNGNKQLKSFLIEGISSFYLYNESNEFIELELKDNVYPELDKESNAVFYVLHENSLGVMSFLPIVDLDTDFLDSDYSYLPSEDLKLDFYRFTSQQKLPVNQVYRVFAQYFENNDYKTVIKLYAVKSDGTEILVQTKDIFVDTSNSFLTIHTIPALYSSTLGNIEVSHFYFTSETFPETVDVTVETFIQNAKGFNRYSSFKRNMRIINAGNVADLTPDDNLPLDGIEVGLYVSGTGIQSNTKVAYVSIASDPPYIRLDKPADTYNITSEITFSSFSDIESFNQELNVNLFEGFNGIVDYIDTFEEKQIKELYNQNSPERFSFSLLRSEYDRLRENYNINLFNKSRNIPYINKWVGKNSSDCRSNEYRLNTNLAFGVRNFKPDVTIETPSSLILHTHEWFYISGIPFWYNKPATENDRNYTFTKVSLTDLYETDFDGFSRSFIRGSHLERFNGEDINTSSKHLYSFIKYDPISNKSFVFFKGTKFELDVKNPTFYDDWRFTAVLKPKIRVPFSNDTNIDIKLVENQKWKTLTFVIEAFIQSYTFPDEELNLMGLYTLDSAKNISLDSSSKIILTDSDLQLTSGVIPTYTYSRQYGTDSIEFSTVDDLSRQITKSITNGNYSDIRIFGLGRRSDDPDNDSKNSHLQLYGRNIIELSPTKLVYSYGDDLSFELLGLNEYTYLNSNPDERSFAPPMHFNHTPTVLFSFERSSSYYLKSGAFSLKDIVKRLSFASLLRDIESGNYTHVLIESDGTKTETYNYSNLKLKYIQPSTISKKRMLEPSPDTDVPTELSINDVIGYKIQETDYDFQIVRYGGDFIPKTKEIVNFIDAESPLFIQEFSSSSKANTRFHINGSNFGKLMNLGYHKVSDKKILTLSDTVYQSSYPLINETGLDYKDFNIFSSTWDYNFYQIYNDKSISVSVNPFQEAKETKTFFGSKLISTPSILSIETFDYSENKDTSKDFWYEVKNNLVEIHLYPTNMISKLLKTDNLRNKIKNSITKLRNDSLFTEEFFEEYIQQNLVKIYKISSVKLFSRGDRITQDLFLNTTPQTRESLLFVEENGIVLDKTLEDILIRKDISNLSNAQLSLSITFDKI